jgi:hypothetical protein
LGSDPQRQSTMTTTTTADTDDVSALTETSFAQGVRCYCCGEDGHIAPDCPKRRTIPQADWYMNRAIQNLQSNNDDLNAETDADSGSQGSRSASTAPTRRTRWSGFMNHQKETAPDYRDVILLDTGSVLDLTANREFTADIYPSRSLLSMATNAGHKMITMEATVPGYGTTWYDEKAIANIFSFANLLAKPTTTRIKYDSNVEDAFWVYTKDAGMVKFPRTTDGLYAFCPPDQFCRSVADNQKEKQLLTTTKLDADACTVVGICNLIDTVEENRKGFTQRQFECAKKARKLYHIMGAPTVANFKHMLRSKIIKDCPVLPEDVNVAEKIFGPDIATLKGKSTRPKPKPVRADLVAVPKEFLTQHRNLELCMDVMYVNGLPMFTGIDRTIKF